MENKILQQNDYNALQLSLPIDLGIKIDEDDVVVSFLKALGEVNLSKYSKRGVVLCQDFGQLKCKNYL